MLGVQTPEDAGSPVLLGPERGTLYPSIYIYSPELTLVTRPYVAHAHTRPTYASSAPDDGLR